MIYLIGGAPRVGKSLIAKKIAENVETEIVSTDDLVDEVGKSLPEAERKMRFPWEGFSGDPSENRLTPEERVRLQEVCARSLEPEIRRLIEAAVQGARSLVVEGVHLMPDFVRQLVQGLGADAIRTAFIGSRNIARVLAGMTKNDNPDDWLRGASADVRRQVAEYVVAESRRMCEMAERNGVAYVERTYDFEGDTEMVIGSLGAAR